MKYEVAHTLRLTFPAPVWEHHCEVRLAPLANAHQVVHAVELTVDPPAAPVPFADCFGNTAHTFCVLTPHAELTIRLRARVETTLANPFDYPVLPPARERAWVEESLRAQPRLWDYLLWRSPATPALAALAGLDLDWPAHDPSRPLLDSVQAALDWMIDALPYERRFAPTALPLADAFTAGAAGCQELSHLLVSLVRSWGFPARYVMGYVDPAYAEDDDDQPLPQLPHAWTEVLIPGAGWRGFDPTTQLVANDTYVAVAVGRDANDALPMKASFKGGEPDGGVKTEDSLDVQPTHDQ